jgi:hypothetical protein
VSVHDCVEQAVATLERAGFSRDQARRDVGVLARFALAWSMADYAAGLRDSAPPGWNGLRLG